MFRKFSQWFDPSPASKGRQAPNGRPCEHSGCLEEGIYRAPKSRYHLEAGMNDWYWFCLIHVRNYNAGWNYYAHMSEAQIEQERRADMTGHRPSWPLGVFAAKGQQPYAGRTFQDPFDLFNEGTSASHAFSSENFSSQSVEAKALTVLGLAYPFSQSDLQKKYRTLVKKHHPDANGGTPEAEEAIKHINEAYEALKRISCGYIPNFSSGKEG